MPQLIELTTHANDSGSLTVFEKLLPGDIKRAFYIYHTQGDKERGKHSHKKATNALIPVAGSCRITVTNLNGEHEFLLNAPNQCLVLVPGDWHIMDQFSADAVLLVMSNEYYDKDDYVFEKP
jgi:WxcM-like, C-terminal